MNKLKLTPEQASYTFDYQEYSIATSVGLNPSYANLLVGKWIKASATWICDKNEYNYLTNVYRAHEATGHSPFLIDLMLSPEVVTECTVIIVPGSFKLDSIAGETYTLSCVLEVKQ